MSRPERARAEIVRVAERSLLVRFPDVDLAEAVRRAHTIFFEAKNERLPLRGETTVLGAGSLLVTLGAGAREEELEAAAIELRRVCDAPERAASSAAPAGPLHEIDVRYGGDDGADLEAVARECGLAPERVVELHAGAEYTVAFVGFAPGYAYLVGLPRELEVARLPSPRERVPAGSVAVAGPFSAVYPHATPGGWRLLGRTDAELFDPCREPPARLAPGDRVRFVVSPR